MFTYKGGSRVGKGTYWNLSKGMRVDVAEEDILPGNDATTYTKMSPVAMVLTGPVIGLVYAVLMPVIGLAAVAGLGVRGMARGIYGLAVKSVSFGWRPRSAYLSGKSKKKKESESREDGNDSQ